jgi:hypothetical protein
MISVMDCPMASAAEKPKISSAPRFQEVMMPSRVLEMIASSEDSTIAASRAWARLAAAPSYATEPVAGAFGLDFVTPSRVPFQSITVALAASRAPGIARLGRLAASF